MESKINILLVSSSEDFTTSLSASINEQEDMTVLAVAEDGEQALALAGALDVQVIITDILLRKLDGVGFIRELKRGGNMPRTIVVSAFLNDTIAAEISALGVDYCFPRPCRVSELIARIRECAHAQPGELTICDYDAEVTNALIAFGVMPHLQGFRYLREAICRNLNEGNATKGITKILYPDLGKAFHTTKKCVERGMRNALDTAWTNVDAQTRDAYFGELTARLTKRPSNSRFIALVTEYIRMKEQEERRGGTG